MINKLMKNLGVSEDEARQILADDKAIDQGEKLFELTPEQAQASKSARQVSRTPTAYNFTKRERKADNDKRCLINILASALCVEDEVTDLEVTNQEREMIFKFGGRKFKIVLSAPRS